ncbi:nuclear fragile X mental retardation-interacting protein 1-like isoform X2 [Actinia tenebrosa]|uniref:Nuclear fragile X mental retardation-interacting protein 1-like isoform X2 n=1 Tax=Actinia tenebrosa TaxID=6105 RepID=A0A6P8HRF4_ACTTE|nr:nuclear fragile X mental retardation-interacting protein 1-like isoform X2 [Actinia tenebrosa]
MYRLPPPNWNTPPNHINGEFLMPNVAVPPRGPFAPFMPGFNHHHTWNQAVVPRAPFYRGSTFNNNQQFHQRPQQQQRNNVEHNDKRGRDEEKSAQEYSCDVCERVFNTKQILDAHLATHVECEQEGCTFKASRKNHAEGRMRIVLETPEQIEKWKEERRKKYPTVANVEKKLAEEKEKRDNGQVAQNRTYRYRGKNQRFHTNQKRGPNQQRNHRKLCNENEKVHHENHEQNGQNTLQTRAENKISDNKCQAQDGDPLSLVLLSESNGHSECEIINAVQTSEVQKPDSTPDPTQDSSSALMSLCASYGDMSSDEESTPNEINNNNGKEDKPSGKETVKENIVTKPSNSSPRRRKRTREQGPRRNMKKQAKRKPTLLEKLLAPEIRHESNVILQCIRYIVKNNFFDAIPQENDMHLKLN